MKTRLPWYTIALAVLCAAGVALALYTMRAGAAIRGDSVRYIMGARNLLAGNGFSRLSGGGEVYPETGFAPLLSFVLAAIGWFGADMYAGARLLNAALFGGSLFLVATLVAMASRSKWMALLACVLVLTAPNVVEWHAWLMSEALFIFLLLLATYAVVMHVQTGRMGFLLLGAAATGTASLARYVGVSLVAAGALAIFVWGEGRPRDRLGRAALFGVLAALPFVLWMTRNLTVGGPGLANREVRYHPFQPDTLRVMLFEPTRWIIPDEVVLPRILRGGLALVLFLGGPALFLWRARTWRGPSAIRQEKAVLPLLLMMLVPLYIAILIVNSLLLDAGTTYGAILRYLTPLFVVVVILEVTTYVRGLPTGRWRRPTTAVLAIITALVLVAGMVGTSALARQSSAQMGFTTIRTTWSDLAARLSAQGPAQPILSENPEMVYFLIGRPAYAMPIKFDQYRQVFREDFAQQLELAGDRLKAGAILVVFGDPSDEQAEVIRLLGVTPLQTFEGAVVYGYPS